MLSRYWSLLQQDHLSSGLLQIKGLVAKYTTVKWGKFIIQVIDKGFTLKMSALKLPAVATLHHQLS